MLGTETETTIIDNTEKHDVLAQHYNTEQLIRSLTEQSMDKHTCIILNERFAVLV